MEGDVIITQDVFVYEMTRRGRARQPDRPPPLDRHRPAAVLGTRALLTARSSGSPPRSMPPKSPANRTRARTAVMTMQTLAHVLPGGGRGRRRRLGVRLSAPVGRAQGREAPGERRRAPSRSRARSRDRASRRSRREQVEETLKELEVNATRSRRTCRSRCSISQAGLTWSKRQFIIISGRSRRRAVRRSSSSSAAACCRRSALASPADFGVPRWLLVVPQEAAREQVPATISPTRST